MNWWTVLIPLAWVAVISYALAVLFARPRGEHAPRRRSERATRTWLADVRAQRATEGIERRFTFASVRHAKDARKSALAWDDPPPRPMRAAHAAGVATLDAIITEAQASRAAAPPEASPWRDKTGEFRAMTAGDQ